MADFHYFDDFFDRPWEIMDPCWD